MFGGGFSAPEERVLQEPSSRQSQGLKYPDEIQDGAKQVYGLSYTMWLRVVPGSWALAPCPHGSRLGPFYQAAAELGGFLSSERSCNLSFPDFGHPVSVPNFLSPTQLLSGAVLTGWGPFRWQVEKPG